MRLVLTCTVATVATAALAAESTTPAGTAILNEKTLWRVRTVRETPEYVTAAGKVGHFSWRPGEAINTNAKQVKWFTDNPDKGWLPEDLYAVEEGPWWRLPAEAPADWVKPGFDDSAWARLRAPLLPLRAGYRFVGDDEGWKVILMRAAFEVTDPAAPGQSPATPGRSPAGAGDLKFSAEFRGGLLVYLNGEEVGRAFMPAGPADLHTPAEPYPADADFVRGGFSFKWFNGCSLTADEQREVLPKRWRKHGMAIPSAKLKRGVNVLALAFPRAPTTMQHRLSRGKGANVLLDVQSWGKTAVAWVRLEGPAGGATKPNTGPLPGRGFRAWNQSVVQKVLPADYPEPCAPLAPVRVTGVRNGTFAGQVVVGDEKPIRGLKAVASDLKGPGTIPASAVRVRYAVAEDASSGVDRGVFFDSLEESPPAEVPVFKEQGGSVQPIWITVTVPADAKPGDYSGTVTVGAEGQPALSVPLALRVVDWTLPDFRNFSSAMDLIQSPESVAMAYDVPMWSEAHFKLLDKSFSLLSPLAAKTLYVTGIRRTHFGNEHAMIRWSRGADGELSPDFSVLEKYLDVATKHLGKIPGVILYIWEPLNYGTNLHAGEGKTQDRNIFVTVVDPATGALSEAEGPAWGTDACKAFWKKLTDGIQPVLKKRGLENSMMLGLIGDFRPTKQAMDDIGNGLPGAKWAVHSHFYLDKWQGHAIGLSNALWGIGVQPMDPSLGYSFGWSNPFWLSYYPRDMKRGSTLVAYRSVLENWMGALLLVGSEGRPFVHKGNGPRGVGRIGADFWGVLKDGNGRIRGSLAGRYPEQSWGQLNLNFCIPYVLGKGREGPVATVRSEAFREGLQESEARIYIEKALLDDGARGLLGDDLLKRCRQALDERIRLCVNNDPVGDSEPWFISSGWNERSEALFGLAGEVARKYGGREPQPNLKNEARK
jgi:hypothetical protein